MDKTQPKKKLTSLNEMFGDVFTEKETKPEMGTFKTEIVVSKLIPLLLWKVCLMKRQC